MSSGRLYGSTDIQHYLFRSGHDLELRSNFHPDLLQSNYSSLDASRHEEYDAGKINGVPLPSQKKLQKKTFVFVETAIFRAAFVSINDQSTI